LAPFNRIAPGKSIGPGGSIAEYFAGTKKFARSIVKPATVTLDRTHRHVSVNDAQKR
jgi:hypothetical protein